MAQFEDLTPEKAIQYVKEHTSIFTPHDRLQVHEVNQNGGEGFVNHVYKIWNNDGFTVILKQAKPYLSFLGADSSTPITVQRNQTELNAYRIRSAIVPQYLLKILHSDPANNLFIQEYCYDPSLRVQFREGLEFSHFPKMIAEYIAKTSFYTSELFLGQNEFKSLKDKFTNPSMRRIMEEILFEFGTFGDPNIITKFFQTHHDFLPSILADKQLFTEVQALKDVYMKKADCLVHGDLHTSNIMIRQNKLIVFDMEYAHVGAISGDLGYLCGNLVSPYVAWLFRKDKIEEDRDRYRQKLLSYIIEIVETFIQQFTQCLQRNGKPINKHQQDYVDLMFKDLIPEISGFIGVQGFVRVLNHPGIQDFDFIKSKEDIEKARILTVLISSSLIKYRRNMSSIQQVIALINEVTQNFLNASSQLDTIQA